MPALFYSFVSLTDPERDCRSRPMRFFAAFPENRTIRVGRIRRCSLTAQSTVSVNLAGADRRIQPGARSLSLGRRLFPSLRETHRLTQPSRPA
jgi:hypothetical protein